MRRLNGVYGQWWTRRHDRVGHVFQGRFKDQIVDREGYLLTLSRYVVMNPVRAGLVEKPEEWRWSSYRATAGLAEPPSFLAATSTLRLFGDDDENALRARFASLVAAPVVDPGPIDRLRSNERILGNDAFKRYVAAAEAGNADPRTGSVAETVVEV